MGCAASGPVDSQIKNIGAADKFPEPREGVKVIKLVDSFLLTSVMIEVHSAKNQPGSSSLEEGCKKMFSSKSRQPATIIIKGIEYGLHTEPAQLFALVEHGESYEMSFTAPCA
mmetsp:Transcript_22770/g.32132  ORF Transcript_22770/g.32132 Transcript_22770/m.32132 type:complete len:113 (-) Transcript_22770:215-553(-)